MGYEKWTKELNENYDQTVSWRRHLHENPELSFQEKNTAAFIKETLEEIGVDKIETNVGNGYGLVARINGGYEGPTIALRADFDALEISEQADVPFQSKNEGIMHACGHDGHTASLLSVEKVLANHREDLHGNVVFIHQNAEEMIPGGAKSMVEAGVLDDVDYVFGIHLNSLVDSERVNFQPTFGASNADFFTVTVDSNEDNLGDALLAATAYLTQGQKIASNMSDASKPVVVTFATVETSNDSYLETPDQVVLKGTVRTLHQETREFVMEKLDKLAQGISLAFDVDAVSDYDVGYPSIKNTPQEVYRAVDAFNRVFPEEEVAELPIGMGGEDFSYYLEEKPGAFFRVGAKFKDDDSPYPHHHPKFIIDESSLLRSGQVFLALVDEYIGQQAN